MPFSFTSSNGLLGTLLQISSRPPEILGPRLLYSRYTSLDAVLCDGRSVVAPSPKQTRKLARTTNYLPKPPIRPGIQSSCSKPAIHQLVASGVPLPLPCPALPCPALSCDRIFNFASDCLSRHILGLAFGSTQTRITDVVNFAIRPLVSLGNAGWTLRLYLHTGSMSPASSCLAPSCTA